MARKFPARYAESTLKRMYGKLNADEKTVSLLRDYFNAMANLYGIIPIKKVCEIITEQNKDTISEQLVLDFAEIVRHEEHFYSVLGMEELYSNAEKSLPIDRELVAQNIALFDFEYYYDLSDMQQGKPYYIPSKSKLLKYADSDYYDKTPQTAALTKFIRSDMSGYPELTFEDIFYEIYIFAQMESDNPADTIMMGLARIGITLDYKQIERFLKIYTELHNNVRMHANRGYTPTELHKLNKDKSAQPVLVCSNDAVIGRDIMENGFPYDEFGDAFAAHFKSMSNKKPAGKIGPNEPCPCGSGKKYKKCCGR